MKRVLLSVVLFGCVGAPVALWSAGPASAEPVADKVRSEAFLQKVLSISDEIHLEKKQEKVFWELYTNYQNDLRKLADRRAALIEDAARIGDNLTDQQATELIRRALAIEEGRLAAKRRNVGLFLAKLPARTVARYFQLENKIQTQVDAKIAEQMQPVGE